MKLKKGKIGFMAIKVDLAKAYDRLSWNFILDTLIDLGLPHGFCNVIMKCIITASMQVSWNGVLSDSFDPSRGISGPPIFLSCV